MSKPVKATPVVPTPSYSIQRIGAGYAVFDQNNSRLSEPDMWVITMKALERILRKELGL